MGHEDVNNSEIFGGKEQEGEEGLLLALSLPSHLLRNVLCVLHKQRWTISSVLNKGADGENLAGTIQQKRQLKFLRFLSLVLFCFSCFPVSFLSRLDVRLLGF